MLSWHPHTVFVQHLLQLKVVPQHSCVFKSSPCAQRWHHPLKTHYVIPFGTLLIAPPCSPLVLLAFTNAEALLAVCFIGGEVTGVCFLLACCIHVCALHHWNGILGARRVAGNLKARSRHVVTILTCKTHSRDHTTRNYDFRLVILWEIRLVPRDRRTTRPLQFYFGVNSARETYKS